MKRWRQPKAKPGELKVAWGKIEYESPQICYAWGEGVKKADSHLLHFTFSCDPVILDYREPRGYKFEPSFLKELESRGYDLTTLKFSIQKKKSSEVAEAA